MDNNFWDKLKKLYENEDGNTSAYETEQPILNKVLEKIEAEFKSNGTYEFVEPIGRGGAGIVFRVKDKRLSLDRALKIPRPREEKLIESVRTEMEYLNKIRHENIIAVHTLGEVEIPDYQLYPYFVMDYIEEAKDLRKKIKTSLSEVAGVKELKGIMQWIALKFYEISRAVDYLHERKIIHFDIKPSNILIDKDDRPILSDLGFAKKKSEENTPVVIGFTLFYAHPTLKAEYQRMSSKNRVRKEMSPKDFDYKFDIYAYGKSLLEILAMVNLSFPDAVLYNYIFVYLHLAACRMLDGKNFSQRDVEAMIQQQIQNKEEVSVYKETWVELDSGSFDEIKYRTLSEISEDFKKLIFDDNFFESIPELNPFYPKRVQSSQGMPAPFSPRVKLIVEHPVFARLISVPQLGLLNYVYPTATHNRLEHSIGMFRNCCLYIQSLYNDPYNPLFKQLVDKEDIKSVLLASLLHDLGQYPFAHEMEEVSKDLKHEEYTLKYLDNSTKDRCGNTLRDIIENVEWGWGIQLDKVKEILKGGNGEDLLYRRKIKTKMLSSIIDGPIDVDKLDYLLRDSQKCYLKYGELIDFDRLIRNLTIIITKGTYDQLSFVVGTYEKGQSAAESLTFARYLLYQSLYWHHTARAIRVMLREAVKSALSNTKAGKGKTKNFRQEFEGLLCLIEDISYNVTVDDVLNLIKKWTDDQGIELIDMIKVRNCYKRILTIHSYPSPGEGKKSLLVRFREVSKMVRFQEKLQEKIAERYIDFISTTGVPKVSLLAPTVTDKALEILTLPKKIICDCPEPVHGTSDILRFIPEPQRLQKNYFKRVKAGERVSEVWKQVYFKLMDIASKGRVFCHPDIKDTLMATLGPDIIQECLESVIREFER